MALPPKFGLSEVLRVHEEFTTDNKLRETGDTAHPGIAVT